MTALIVCSRTGWNAARNSALSETLCRQLPLLLLLIMFTPNLDQVNDTFRLSVSHRLGGRAHLQPLGKRFASKRSRRKGMAC